MAGGGQTLAAARGIGSEQQFRTAHTGGTVHAALMLGLVGAIRELALNVTERRSLVTWIAVMGWGNSVGYTVGAFLGKRGLEPKSRGDLVPFSCFLAAISGLVRTLQLLWRGCQAESDKRVTS